MGYNRDWLYDLKIGDAKIKDMMTDKEKYGDFINSVTTDYINSIKVDKDPDKFIANVIKESISWILQLKFISDIITYRFEETGVDTNYINNFLSESLDAFNNDLISKGLLKETSE